MYIYQNVDNAYHSAYRSLFVQLYCNIANENERNRYNYLLDPSQLIHQLHDYPINLFNLKLNYIQKLKVKVTGPAFFLVTVCVSCDKDDRLVDFVSMIALENNNICLVVIHEGPRLGVTGLSFSSAIQPYIPNNRTVKLAYTIKFNCKAYDPVIDGVILDAFTIPRLLESCDPRDPNSEYFSNKVPIYIVENIEIIEYELK